MVRKRIHHGFSIRVNELKHIHGILARARSAAFGTKCEANQALLDQTVVVLLVVLLLLLLLLVLSILLSLLILVVVLHLLFGLFLLPLVVDATPLTAAQVLEGQTSNLKLVVSFVLVLVPLLLFVRALVVLVVLIVLIVLNTTKMLRRLDHRRVLEKGTPLTGVGADHFGRGRREKKSDNRLLEHLEIPPKSVSAVEI